MIDTQFEYSILKLTTIIDLQEVDKFDELASLFQKDGYAGIYKVCFELNWIFFPTYIVAFFICWRFQQRTGEASDGCAIFWKEKE